VGEVMKGNGMMVALQQQMKLWFETVTELASPDSSLPPISAMMLDPFGGNLIRPKSVEIVGSGCKTFIHITQGASAFYLFGAPSEKAGISDFEDVIEKIYVDEKSRNGREKKEILEAVSIQCSYSCCKALTFFLGT